MFVNVGNIYVFQFLEKNSIFWNKHRFCEVYVLLLYIDRGIHNEQR